MGDEFFEGGGDWLKGMRGAWGIKKEVGREIGVEVLLEGRRMGEIGGYVVEGEEKGMKDLRMMNKNECER
ncbi:hypothetical protein, partial [Bacillus velezensis]|uniref:hypothetical protein n=1 Tax=Bacillus velezensis TaxID=492670 RepID=UPI0011A567D7